jgi:hypothetical protein
MKSLGFRFLLYVLLVIVQVTVVYSEMKLMSVMYSSSDEIPSVAVAVFMIFILISNIVFAFVATNGRIVNRIFCGLMISILPFVWIFIANISELGVTVGYTALIALLIEIIFWELAHTFRIVSVKTIKSNKYINKSDMTK